MTKTLFKDAVRSIRTSLVSWIAIAFSIAVSCGLFLGASFFSLCADHEAADFFERTNYLDLQVVASPGLTGQEVAELGQVNGVRQVEGGYEVAGSRVSLNGAALDANIQMITERVSRPELLEGELPQKADECALDVATMDALGVSLGDTVRLEVGPACPEGFLVHERFLVTARVRHPFSLLKGDVSYVGVMRDAFDPLLAEDRFTHVYVDVDTKTSEALTPEAILASSAPRSEVEEVLERIGERRKDDGGSELASLVLTRTEQGGFASISQNVRSMQTVTLLVATIFALVSAIVCVSTITILVADQRRQLGAMKALGFGSGHILARFLVYTLLAAGFGLACSVAVTLLFEGRVGDVFEGLYVVGSFAPVYDGCQVVPLAFAVIVAVALVTFGSLLVNTLNVSAVSLMRPPVPANRKWRPVRPSRTTHRGSVYLRAIVRNLRTDLPRALTAVAIVAGSCYLVGLGLTLRGAFQNMMARSVELVTHYDLELGLVSGADERDLDAVRTWLDAEDVAYAEATRQAVPYRYGDVRDYATLLVLSADATPDYFSLTSLDGSDEFAPSADGVLVQNRIAERLGIDQGDELVLCDETLQPHGLTVDGVFRNYLGRLVVLSPEAYEMLFGRVPQANVLFVRLGSREEGAFVARLTDEFPQLTATATDELPDVVASGFRTVFDLVVAGLVVLALVLSVMVLSNLAAILLRHRAGELEVMAINGFGLGRRVGYVLIETALETAIGLMAGVLLGAYTHEAVIRAVEVGDVMFDRLLDPTVWLFAVGIEALFAGIVNLVVFLQLRRAC